jgi:hypothetical protein
LRIQGAEGHRERQRRQGDDRRELRHGRARDLGQQREDRRGDRDRGERGGRRQDERKRIASLAPRAVLHRSDQAAEHPIGATALEMMQFTLERVHPGSPIRSGDGAREAQHETFEAA